MTFNNYAGSMNRTPTFLVGRPFLLEHKKFFLYRVFSVRRIKNKKSEQQKVFYLVFCCSDLISTIFLFLIIVKFGGKKIKMKKKRQFTVIIEEGEDGYLIGTALELKGCHTQGKTMEELLKNVKEAIELYLEVEGKGEPYIKEIIGIQKVAV